MRNQIKLPKSLFSLLTTILLSTSIFAQTFQQITKGTPADKAANDHFGAVVAIDGNTAIVGVPNEDEDVNNDNTLQAAGSAYIFQKDGEGNWNISQKITASDRATTARFGSSVAISGDYAVVGAFTATTYSSEGVPVQNSGAAYIFHRNVNGEWVETQKITASDKVAGDWFGYAVDIAGNHIIVGVYMVDEVTANGITKPGTGAAYLFALQEDGNWTEIQKLTAGNSNPFDNFGRAVAISGDYIIVSAPLKASDSNMENAMPAAGSTYIFRKNNENQWIFQQEVTAIDRKPQMLFGWSIDISGDYAVIGTLENDDDDGSESDEMAGAGTAYIFHLNTDGTWVPTQKITPQERHIYDQFGNSVAISGDYAAIGAHHKKSINSESTTVINGGAAYIFRLTNEGEWIELQKVIPADVNQNDMFGNAVAIDDNNLLIGAAMADIDALNDAGAVYFFNRETLPTGYIQVEECESYLSPSGDHIYTESGIYPDTLLTADGQDSILTIELSITAIDNTVTAHDGTLICQETGAIYQWIDCATEEPVPGATNMEFTPVENGSYAVTVAKGNCVTTSACIEIDVLDIAKPINQEPKLYPNPTSTDVTIDFGNTSNTFRIAVYSATGNKVLEMDQVRENKANLPTASLNSGVYFVKIQSAHKQQILKFVKR